MAELADYTKAVGYQQLTSLSSATTHLRSDGAPALGVGISPTWTGNHIFAPTAGDTVFSAGNVGVAAAVPVAKFDVRDGSYAISITGLAHGNTDWVATSIGALYGYTGGNGGAYTVGATANAVASVPYDLYGIFGTSDPTDTVPAIRLTGMKKSGGTGGTALGALETVLQLLNFTTPVTTVLGSGNVGIGMIPTSQLELSTDSAKKPTTNLWTITSDERLKENILPADIARCYQIVKTLPLKRFRWRDEIYTPQQAPDRNKIGWLARDVQAIFPRSVGTSEFALTPVADGSEEIDEPVTEDVITEENIIEIIAGVPTQLTRNVTRSRAVTKRVRVVDSAGKPLLDKDGEPLLFPVPELRKVQKPKTRIPTLVDCLSLNADQIYAAMYGAIQVLMQKVETLEAAAAARPILG